jgi:hypothetical protein
MAAGLSKRRVLYTALVIMLAGCGSEIKYNPRSEPVLDCGVIRMNGSLQTICCEQDSEGIAHCRVGE